MFFAISGYLICFFAYIFPKSGKGKWPQILIVDFYKEQALSLLQIRD